MHIICAEMRIIMAENENIKGMKFPPQIDEATGRFKISTGAENIKESIYLILMTQKTERWLRSGFGSNILNYTFMDTGSTMLNIMSRELLEDISSNEPRVTDIHIRMDTTSKEGCLLVYVDYTIKENSQRDEIIFPFYLNVADT